MFALCAKFDGLLFFRYFIGIHELSLLLLISHSYFFYIISLSNLHFQMRNRELLSKNRDKSCNSNFSFNFLMKKSIFYFFHSPQPIHFLQRPKKFLLPNSILWIFKSRYSFHVFWPFMRRRSALFSGTHLLVMRFWLLPANDFNFFFIKVTWDCWSEKK